MEFLGTRTHGGEGHRETGSDFGNVNFLDVGTHQQLGVIAHSKQCAVGGFALFSSHVGHHAGEGRADFRGGNVIAQLAISLLRHQLPSLSGADGLLHALVVGAQLLVSGKFCRFQASSGLAFGSESARHITLSSSHFLIHLGQVIQVGCLSFAQLPVRTVQIIDGIGTVENAIGNALTRESGDAAALLTLSEGWQDAWRNEQGPVQEDLASLQKLCSETAANSRIDVDRDRSWTRERSNRLAKMTNELARGALTPSAALDELDSTSQEVRSRADALAQRALEADSSSHRERRMRQYQDSRSGWDWGSGVGYSGSWSMGGHHSSYNPASTIRINPASPGAQASGVRWSGSGSSSQFSSPISGLVTGYSSAATWTPPSSSSSSSGSSSDYSGGGGFSGAGSSSHF